MPSLNRVTLIGHLGRDPESKFLSNGDAVCNISIATTEKWKKDGVQQEKTEWHRIVFFRQLAEIAGKYLTKGAPVYVEGKLTTREWEKDGVKRYSTEIVADRMQMLGGKKDVDAEEQETAPAPAAKKKAKSVADLDSDIPF